MLPRDRRRLRLGLFLWGVGEGLFIYLLPLYVRNLGGDATAVGLTLGVQFAVAGVGTLLAGPVVDRIGHLPLIRASGIVASPGLLIWIFAPSWQWIIPGTALYALSFSIVPALNGYIISGHDDHVGAFGSTFAFFSLGMIVTPGIGGFIATQLHSIRPVFALALVMYIAGTVAVWNLTPHPIEPHEPLGTVVRALFTNRPLMRLCVFLIGTMFVLTLTNSYVGPYLQDVDHANDGTVGLLGACISLGEFAIGLSLGRLSAWLGRLATMLALQAALALSLTLLLVVHQVPFLAGAFMLRGAIMNVPNIIFGLVGGVLPQRQQGAGFGLLELCFQSGMMAAAYVGGLLYAAGATYPFMAGLALLAVLAVATLSQASLFAGRAPVEPAPEIIAAR
jgi:predicted MFS family arabinose efflux permease